METQALPKQGVSMVREQFPVTRMSKDETQKRAEELRDAIEYQIIGTMSWTIRL